MRLTAVFSLQLIGCQWGAGQRLYVLGHLKPFTHSQLFQRCRKLSCRSFTAIQLPSVVAAVGSVHWLCEAWLAADIVVARGGCEDNFTTYLNVL